MDSREPEHTAPGGEVDNDDSVCVVLCRDEAESLCWAYAGEESFQACDDTSNAIRKFQLATRVGSGNDRPVLDDQIAVRVTRAEANAMGYAGDQGLVDEVLTAIEEAL